MLFSQPSDAAHVQTLQFTTPQNERVRYSIYAKPGTTEESWSIDQLVSPHPEAFMRRLGSKLSCMNVRTAYSFKLNRMDANVLRRHEFTRTFHLGSMVQLLFPEVPTEAVRLEPLEALVLGIGGCGLLALSYVNNTGKGCLLGAHAGRSSLVDMSYVRDRTPSRENFSIIDALVRYAEERGGKRSDMILRSFGTIPWERFPHPTEEAGFETYHGINFELMAHLEWRYGDSMIKAGPGYREHLCMSSLIEAQALEAGIGTIDVHGYELSDEFAVHPNPTRNFMALVYG